LNLPLIELAPGERKLVVFDAEKGVAERNGQPRPASARSWSRRPLAAAPLGTSPGGIREGF